MFEGKAIKVNTWFFFSKKKKNPKQPLSLSLSKFQNQIKNI